MAGYQLWSPWTPLDESFQWLRHTTPTPCSKHPFRASPCFPDTPSDLEVQLCFQEVLDSPLVAPGESPKLPCHTSELQAVNKKGVVRKPQPVHLHGVDSVFGRVITAQPPKWTGTFRVSDKSAFCKIISREHQWLTGLKEPQIQMTVTTLYPPAVCHVQEVHLCFAALQVKGPHLTGVPHHDLWYVPKAYKDLST